jgi:hypothetical protein
VQAEIDRAMVSAEMVHAALVALGDGGPAGWRRLGLPSNCHLAREAAVLKEAPPFITLGVTLR